MQGLRLRSGVFRLVLATVLLVTGSTAAAGLAALDREAEPLVTPPVVERAVDPGGEITVDKRVTTRAIPPRPDVVLLVDGTGSMSDTIGNVRRNLGLITSAVRESQPDSQFAVATYGDVLDGPRAFEVLQPLTADLDAVQRGVDALTADRGGSSPGPAEDWIHALWQIAHGAGGTIDFRPGSSPIIVLVGDASSHDPSLGYSLQDAVTALRTLPARVLAIDVDTPVGDGLNGINDNGQGYFERPPPASAPDQGRKIAEATGGRLFDRIDPDAVARTIAEGLANLPTTVTHRLVDCSPHLTVDLQPPSVQLTSGQQAAFTETIRVSPDAPGGAVLTCAVQFAVGTAGGNGDPELRQTISITVNDVVAPVVTVDDRRARATGPDGAVIDYTATAEDAVDGPLTVKCTPPSGSVFPVGSTTVTCTATDAAGNTGTDTATFVVIPFPGPPPSTGRPTPPPPNVPSFPPSSPPPASSPPATTPPAATPPASTPPAATPPATSPPPPPPPPPGTPPSADVAVTVAVTPSPAYAGSEVLVRLTLTNAGPDTASGVSVTAALPEVDDPAGRAVAAQTGCTDTEPCTLVPGARTEVTIPVTYREPVDGVVRATVSADQGDPARGNNTAAAGLRVLRPELTVTPGIGVPGQVVQARGRDFPPGTVVELTWQPGITATAAPVRVGPDGTFVAQMLILRKDRLGERELRASGPGYEPLSVPFLVVPRSIQPPDFAGRG
ncbi:HYR domain-containing protein [Allostreptomyces psammosilenae]|uniref:VWFA domain-containing protein n=1 Tax=Allostreptomyces psammosilenae TaxID=1892865 RepID=A0A853A0G1_9ACTN|nr:HYR domain-containing protein [Allostreptomyces psammosilenae]NYI03878.1 hypothetical protein [Allostreptomyces psammosilenae]